MKKNTYYMTATSVAALVASSSAALADDFSGVFAGISLGNATGVHGDNCCVGDYDISSGGHGSVYAGYDFAFANNMFAGVEVSRSLGQLTGSSNGSDYAMDAMLDIKARLGKSFGKTALYGFVGFSEADMISDGAGETYNATGHNFGLGAEYMVTKRLGLGLELMRRVVDADLGYGTATVDSASFRATLRF